MEAIGYILLAVLVAIAGFRLWRRNRRLTITRHHLRCPIHDQTADVVMMTDPAAPSCRQHVAVESCSLQPGTAVTLPERVGYLADSPPCPVRLAPPSAVHPAAVACRQTCVFALNASATPGALPALECASGVSDAVALAQQAIGTPRLARLLWYTSL